ncbi:NYN domain-containing protein [Xenophilus sp. Marseille-Q4582]|uniref:NYN domain-containing protein n=1 Tax=Xenophilus sp. Marseille-Q4582 TaxID=2866600 RepID=UPI001CE438B7|nr:NYN domain-containing protein [Xenophilus sp. Marseille-Q4582]
MNRYVVMVDAGYLLRQAVEMLSQRASSSRADLDIPDPAALMDLLLAQSRATLDLAGKELLRIYWYDGVMAHGFTAQQKAIMQVDDLQFRAGTIDWRGHQKGVDSLIVSDLIELTTHHAICDAVLVTGDSDLAVGMELAQRRGVRIAVLGVEDLAAGVAHHQSFEITTRADRVGRLGRTELQAVVRYVPGAAAAPAYTQYLHDARTPAPPLDTDTKAQIAAAVQAFAAQLAMPLAQVVDPSTHRIDAAVDKALLQHVYGTLGRKLAEAEKVFIRQVFRDAH